MLQGSGDVAGAKTNGFAVLSDPVTGSKAYRAHRRCAPGSPFSTPSSRWARRVGARWTPSSFGVTEQMLPALARDALADPVSRKAPWLPTPEALVDLLEARL